MKKVFSSNSQLAHVWANQLQSVGKGNSMFFQDETIYSYGRHYEIATFVDAPNNERVVFFNTNSYSNSTAKHSNHVYRAIPDGIRVFSVPFGTGTNSFSPNSFSIARLPQIVELIKKDIEKLLSEQIKAKSNYGKFSLASGKVDELIEFSQLFNLSEVKKSDFELFDKAKEKSELLRATEGERLNVKKQKQIDAERDLLERWLKNDYNGQLYNSPVHLRINGDGKLIQTSHGANVSLSEALTLLNKLRKGEVSRGEKIGGFTFIESTNDHVKIGCHVIGWDVINRFFKK